MNRHILILVFLCLNAAFWVCNAHDISLNDTCIDLKFKELHEEVQTVIHRLAKTPLYTHAKVEKSENFKHEVSVRWTQADENLKKIRTYL